MSRKWSESGQSSGLPGWPDSILKNAEDMWPQPSTSGLVQIQFPWFQGAVTVLWPQPPIGAFPSPSGLTWTRGRCVPSKPLSLPPASVPQQASLQIPSSLATSIYPTGPKARITSCFHPCLPGLFPWQRVCSAKAWVRACQPSAHSRPTTQLTPTKADALTVAYQACPTSYIWRCHSAPGLQPPGLHAAPPPSWLQSEGLCGALSPDLLSPDKYTGAPGISSTDPLWAVPSRNTLTWNGHRHALPLCGSASLHDLCHHGDSMYVLVWLPCKTFAPSGHRLQSCSQTHSLALTKFTESMTEFFADFKQTLVTAS